MCIMTSLDVTKSWRFSQTSWNIIISLKIIHTVTTTSCATRKDVPRRGQSPTCNGCCILLLLVFKMILTLCNLRWWWCLSCHELAQRPHLHLLWTSLATCTGGGFLVPTSAFTNVHSWLAMLPPPTATCTGGGCPLPTRHLLMCTHAHEHVLQLALCGGIIKINEPIMMMSLPLNNRINEPIMMRSLPLNNRINEPIMMMSLPLNNRLLYPDCTHPLQSNLPEDKGLSIYGVPSEIGSSVRKQAETGK